MAYPLLIYLDEETKLELITYLNNEIDNSYAERGDWTEDLTRWQTEYWAKPATEQATFPFVGAANIVIPLTAIAVETIHSRVMQTLFAFPQFVAAEAKVDSWSNIDKAYAKYLDHELLHNMAIKSKLGNSILEIVKYGTGVGKVSYERTVRNVKQEIDGTESEFEVVVKQGAVYNPVPLSRFMMPYYANDPEEAPWVGEEHSATPHQFKELELGGLFYPDISEEIEAWLKDEQNSLPEPSQGNEFERNQQELEKRVPVWPQRVNWYEIWMSWDTDKSGRKFEIVLHYHRESSKFLAIRYNWNTRATRDYERGIYFPVEYRWWGLGVCKQNEQFLIEVTTQHRQRLDNATLANMRMFKVSKLSGYGPNEPIFPGKMWFLDDMDHIDSLQMGEIYPSAYNNEQATLIYSQQRTGVNESILGMPQQGTPGTATSDLARIQESNKKFDYTYGNIKEFTTAIIRKTAIVNQQFGNRNIEFYARAEPDGPLILQALQLPEEYILDGLVIELHAAGQQHNKVMDRQNWQQVAALLTQYYTNIMMIAQMGGDPNLLALAQHRALTASTEAMRQILETFDIRNINKLIISELTQDPNARAISQQSGNGGGTIPSQSGGVPDLNSLIQQIGAGSV